MRVLCSRAFYDKRISHEVEGDSLGDEFKGYVFKITGGNVRFSLVFCVFSLVLFVFRCFHLDSLEFPGV